MKNAFSRSSGRLLSATLLISTAIMSPVLADGTKAGTSIKNQATATYQDANDPTNIKIPAISNTVEVVTAEVAGIEITAIAPAVNNLEPNSTAIINFDVRNSGNDPTKFVIPWDAIKVVPPGGSDVDISNKVTVQTVQVYAANGTTLLGTITNGGNFESGSIAIGEKVIVRVTTAIAADAPQGSFKVSLGSTDPADSDNQALTGTPGTSDVYTKDNDNSVSDEIAGTPVNGIREAMDTSAKISVSAKPIAYASVLKAAAGFAAGTNPDPNVFTDDTLSYKLALRVENPSSVPVGYAVSNLHGTRIQVDGNFVARVLISDVIPANTQLKAVVAPPTGWTAVYTADNPTTVKALDANWQTSAAAIGGIDKATRVGFIVDAAPYTGGPGIPKPATSGGKTEISGFEFSVTPTASFTGGSIYNIAQVFGQSRPSTLNAGVPEAPDPTKGTGLVYDESGDQTTNNGLGTTPPTPVQIIDGKADPTNHGTDKGAGTDPTKDDTNQGPSNESKDPGGEDTVFTLANTPLNGPKDRADATGLGGSTNTDFTNQSIVPDTTISPLPAPDQPLSDRQTAPVIFTNTVKNTAGTPETITLLPTVGTVPDGTYVTLQYTPPSGTEKIAIYKYNATTQKFEQVSTYTQANGTVVTATETTTPITLDNIPANGNASYQTTIDLPSANQFQAYSVTVKAFYDLDKDGVDDASDPFNLTTDRVYTGFIKLEKSAEIIDKTTGQVKPGNQAAKGDFIRYIVKYTNMSQEKPEESGTSLTLTAKDLVITEDGTNNNPNNWALDTDNDGTIDTSHDGNPATDSKGGTLTYFNGANATDSTQAGVTKYVDTIQELKPTETGDFIFRRKMN